MSRSVMKVKKTKKQKQTILLLMDSITVALGVKFGVEIVQNT